MQKIINMCGAGPGTGGLGARGWGQGGSWNSSQVTTAHILLWVRMYSCGGGGNDGVGRGVGEGGWGRALIEVLNKTGIVTFSLVIVMHFTRWNRPKSQGIPNFGGIPIKWHHNLAKTSHSCTRNEIARDFPGGRRRCHGCHWPHLKHFKWILWANGSISRLEINNMQRSWSDLNVLWTPGLWI